MRSGVEELAQHLLSNIFTTTDLKMVSVALEQLSQNQSFKHHAHEIATDTRLTDSVKKTQLLHLFKDINIPILYTFFSDMFSKHEFWMFSSKQFDYFDEFVQTFQLATEKVTVVNLVTPVDLLPPDLTKISQDLAQSLGTHVVLHLQVNPGILGGIQVRIGNLVFDYSLRSKFHQFQRQWIAQMARTSELVGRE